MGRPRKTEAKKVEPKKVDSKDGNEADLKGKIESMARIIEELSDAPQTSHDTEGVIDSKLSDFNEKIGVQMQELKSTLSELDKKAEKPTKIKEDIEAMLKGLEEKLQPKFSDLEKKIETMGKTDNMDKFAETLHKEETKAVESALAKEELVSLKSNIGDLTRSMAGIKEDLRALDRLPVLERKLQVESILDPEDVKKLERVISAVDQMIPKKIVDEKLNIFMQDSKDFHKAMLKNREDLVKDFSDQVARLEGKVEIVFKLQKSYAELIEKKIEDMFSSIQSYFEPDFQNLKRGQTFLVTKKEMEELRGHIDLLGKKNEDLISNLEKSIEKRALRGEMDRTTKDLDSGLDYIRDYLENVNNELYFLKKTLPSKEWLDGKIDKETSEMRKMNFDLEGRIDKFEDKMEKQRAAILGEFKAVVEERRTLKELLSRQREKIGTMVGKLVEK